MQVSFHYNKPEVINALRFHFLNKGEIKALQAILILLLLFALAGFLMNIVTPAVLAAIMLMLVIVVAAFWYILPVSIYNKAATFKESIRLQYNDEGMTIGTHVGQRLVLWQNFNRVVETRDFFYLYRDAKSFFLIPTAAFRDETEKEGFTNLLKSKFGNYLVK